MKARDHNRPFPRACAIYPRECARCGTLFIARDTRQINCSRACGVERHKQRSNKSTPRTRNKRHLRRAVEKYSDITAEQEAAMRARARKCPLCGVRMTDAAGLHASKELDHIVPLGVGGTHTHGNVRIICRLCNLKRPKDGSDYAGPVTLWAQVPEIMMPTPKAKPAPAPVAPPRPQPMVQCHCGQVFAESNARATRCPDCRMAAGRAAVEMRSQGLPWKEIAAAIGYTIAGAHLLAQRNGLYAEQG